MKDGSADHMTAPESLNIAGYGKKIAFWDDC